MPAHPKPLRPGTILAERFVLGDLLGRGGFSLVYEAEDRVRGDEVVVKEFAPDETPRREDGVIALAADEERAHMMRQRFLQEAAVLRRVRAQGIPSLRATFIENGTAYAVTDLLSGAQTLDAVLRRMGPLSLEAAENLLFSLLDILERVHAVGVLHRDIKPSNILITDRGEVRLIDFGAARDWVPEEVVTHTVMHTPGYAPPEQLSERAPRGPSADVYGLCATLYHALTGFAPPSAADRIADVPLTPLHDLRPDVPAALSATIEAGLALRAADRPATVADLRRRLTEIPASENPDDLASLDETLYRLRTLQYERRACPACDGVLVDARPLRRMSCPVCRLGEIHRRDLDPRLCPVCREGRLQEITNERPLRVCPVCARGRLDPRRRGLLRNVVSADCPECDTSFTFEGDRITDTTNGKQLSETQWREGSGRAPTVMMCDTCPAQLDLLPDGRTRQVEPPSDQPPHYPEEWTRIAAGLPPDAGNAACDECGADYWLEKDRLTLLDAERDPHRFAAHSLGRALRLEDVPWLAVGKSSGHSGPVCDTCETEFDHAGDFLRLVTSEHPILGHHTGLARTLEDWHRIARQLPLVSEEPAFAARLDDALRQAFHRHEIPFESNTDLHWRGRARRVEDFVESELRITDQEIGFGSLLRRWRVPLDAIVAFEAKGDTLNVTVSGRPEPVQFEIEPIELRAALRSGEHRLVLHAEDLAVRLAARARTS